MTVKNPKHRFLLTLLVVAPLWLLSAAEHSDPKLGADPKLRTDPKLEADPKLGKDLFERRCTGCHQLDQVRLGPKLRGVFGRQAGTDPGYPYSDALKASHIIWNEPSLDRWLADTEALVPDNDMAFRVPNTDERAALIAYLKSLPVK